MRPGKPYPATFRMLVDPPRVELGLPPRQGGVFPLDHEPLSFSGPDGNRTHHTDLARISRLPWYMPARLSETRLSETRSGLEPDLPPYHSGVPPQHSPTVASVTEVGVDPHYRHALNVTAVPVCVPSLF